MPEARLAGPPALTAGQEQEFDRHARRLGHDPARLRGDTELVSYPVLETAADMINPGNTCVPLTE